MCFTCSSFIENRFIIMQNCTEFTAKNDALSFVKRFVKC